MIVVGADATAAEPLVERLLDALANPCAAAAAAAAVPDGGTPCALTFRRPAAGPRVAPLTATGRTPCRCCRTAPLRSGGTCSGHKREASTTAWLTRPPRPRRARACSCPHGPALRAAVPARHCPTADGSGIAGTGRPLPLRPPANRGGAPAPADLARQPRRAAPRPNFAAAAAAVLRGDAGQRRAWLAAAAVHDATSSRPVSDPPHDECRRRPAPPIAADVASAIANRHWVHRLDPFPHIVGQRAHRADVTVLEAGFQEALRSYFAKHPDTLASRCPTTRLGHCRAVPSRGLARPARRAHGGRGHRSTSTPPAPPRRRR